MEKNEYASSHLRAYPSDHKEIRKRAKKRGPRVTGADIIREMLKKTAE